MSGKFSLQAGRRPVLVILLVLVLALFAVFSSRKKAEPDGNGPKGRGGPVLVTVISPRIADVPVEIEAIGNVEASETVSVQPQISGQLRGVYFRQGDFVNRGQLLFEVDQRLQREAVTQAGAIVSRSQATVQQSQSNVAKAIAQAQLAQANLERDEAQLELARAQEARYRNLLSQNYVTREQYEQMRTTLNTAQATMEASRAALGNARAQVQADRAAVRTAQASTASDQAALDSARIQLGFTRIVAPISGKTGPLLVSAGNMVQANTTSLVTIGRMDPVFVAFSVPEKELASIRQALAQDTVPVTASVKGGETQGVASQSATGRLFFIDNNVDATSGTVRLKAEFTNSGRILWPGRFTDVTVRLGTERNRLLVPASAVQRGQQGDFVYVVEAQRAKVKPVVVDRIMNGNAVIRQGLQSGDAVVRDGQMRLAPDAKVKIARSAS